MSGTITLPLEEYIELMEMKTKFNDEVLRQEFSFIKTETCPTWLNSHWYAIFRQDNLRVTVPKYVGKNEVILKLTDDYAKVSIELAKLKDQDFLRKVKLDDLERDYPRIYKKIKDYL